MSAELIAAVRGGRVAHSGFLAPAESAALAAALRRAGCGVHAWGGYPGARRRVVTAYPAHLPEATTPLCALYAECEAPVLAQALADALGEAAVGDSLPYQQGAAALLLAEAAGKLPAALELGGRPLALQPLVELAVGSSRRLQLVVPSLRVDLLGAKAFGLSRSYFAKGIAAGNVLINGELAGKASSAEVGDEVYAEGLGRFYLRAIVGQTRRGNLKVELERECP